VLSPSFSKRRPSLCPSWKIAAHASIAMEDAFMFWTSTSPLSLSTRNSTSWVSLTMSNVIRGALVPSATRSNAAAVVSTLAREGSSIMMSPAASSDSGREDANMGCSCCGSSYAISALIAASLSAFTSCLTVVSAACCCLMG